jgi:drug/metabolite transporter (DMT)-like permease
MQKAPMSAGGADEPFHHPWLQAGLMMAGELLCLPVWLCSRSREDAEASARVPKWVFLVPCCCDLTATALLCMGLALIAVSVAQMCRGTIVVFVCIMSFIFLGRRQRTFQLFGIANVFIGIVLVALSAIFKGGHDGSTNSMLAGISLCVFAQIFQASMFVYEEKIMSQHTVQPLQVVGMEGLFGIVIASLLLIVMYPFGVNTPGALYQIRTSPPLLWSVIGSMFAVAIFNFAGATVTQKSSAVARTTIKISSTICIWIMELSLGWNTFSYWQLFGFMFIAAGTIIYNRLVVIPALEPAEEQPVVKSPPEGWESALPESSNKTEAAKGKKF